MGRRGGGGCTLGVVGDIRAVGELELDAALLGEVADVGGVDDGEVDAAFVVLLDLDLHDGGGEAGAT